MSWKAAENARLAEAEARWAGKVEQAVAKARAQSEAGHAEALLEAEKNWEATESARLAEKEAQWREQTAKAVADSRAETEAIHADALGEAEKNWKAAESTRLAELEAYWAELTAKAVADARAQTGTERDEVHGAEAARLRSDIASLQAAFVAREAELRETRAQLQQHREHSEQEIAARIADARSNWKAKEESRLAMAREQWQAEIRRAVGEARAEGRAEGETLVVSPGKDIELRRLREECIVLKATLAARETELRRARKETAFDFTAEQQEANENWTPGEFRRNSLSEAERQRRTKRRRVIAGALAAGIAACAVVFHGQIEQLVAKGSQLGQAQEVAPAPPPAPAPVPAAIIRAATVRAAPTALAKTIQTLQRGTEVGQLDQFGTWTYIQFKRKDDPTQQQQGWVETSFLKQEKRTSE
jgi:hypothetical protein